MEDKLKPVITDRYALYNGDCVDVARTIPDNSVHFEIFSPPFANLYIYSDDLRDMGNCKNTEEFFEQFDYLIPELHRVLMNNRLCAVHCKNIVKYKGRDGVSGWSDFRGDIIPRVLFGLTPYLKCRRPRRSGYYTVSFNVTRAAQESECLNIW